MCHTHQGRPCEHRDRRQLPTTQQRLNQLSTLWQLDFCLPVSRTVRKLLLLFSHSIMSNSLQPHGLQNASLPCPSSSPGACSNSCPLSQWCHPTISSSAVPFSSCPQSFPTSGSFPVSWFFTSGGQSIRASASASTLPMNIQGWFPLEWTGLISLLSKGLSRYFLLNFWRKKNSPWKL